MISANDSADVSSQLPRRSGLWRRLWDGDATASAVLLVVLAMYLAGPLTLAIGLDVPGVWLVVVGSIIALGTWWLVPKPRVRRLRCVVSRLTN